MGLSDADQRRLQPGKGGRETGSQMAEDLTVDRTAPVNSVSSPLGRSYVDEVNGPTVHALG